MPESPARHDSDDDTAGDADSVASTVEVESESGFRLYRSPHRLTHHRRRLGASPVASGGGLGDLFNKAKPPYEKELDKLLAELGRLDPSLSLQANIERFKSRLTSPECIAVLNHTTFAEYILSQAVQTIDGKPYHVGVELTSALRTMRTKLEQMSAKEFDGSNLSFSISHLPKMPYLQLEKPALAQIFDDRKGILLDLGGYAQVELLYDPNSDDPPSWPPQWKIGKGFNPGPPNANFADMGI